MNRLKQTKQKQTKGKRQNESIQRHQLVQWYETTLRDLVTDYIDFMFDMEMVVFLQTV